MTRARFLLASAVLAVLAAAFAGGASGAPRLTAAPANDNFATAAGLTDRFGYVDATNVDATREPGEPNHAGNPGGASVWYVWTAPHRGHVSFSTCDSELDTLLAAYTGAALASLQPVASDDNGCEYGAGSRVSFVTEAGATYRIAIDGSGGVTGAFWLSWGLGPANDDFPDAAEITGDSGLVAGDNFAATRQDGEPEHGGPGGGSVWYRWTAPSSGPATFDLCASDFDTLLAVYTGSSLSELTQIATNDQDCGDGSRVSFQATGGTTYSVAVDGFYGSTGTIALSHSRVPAAPRSAVPPSVVGIAVDGATLSAAVGEWSGLPPFAFGYQWLRCNFSGFSCQPLAGATAATYGLTSSDVGSRLRVAVTASNAGGAATEVSGPTATVAPVPPSNVEVPIISGDAYVGEELASDHGLWAGTVPIFWSYQWQRCNSDGADCVDISDETSPFYTVASDDLSGTLRILVIASNGAGLGRAVSQTTEPVTRKADRATCVVPRVNGKLLKAAKRAIQRAHCAVGRVRLARSTRARGRVLSQSPRPGARRPGGTRVNLVVSRGRRR